MMSPRERREQVGRIERHGPVLLAALVQIVKTADSGAETGISESECVAANWDVLGPSARAAIAAATQS